MRRIQVLEIPPACAEAPANDGVGDMVAALANSLRHASDRFLHAVKRQENELDPIAGGLPVPDMA